MRRDLVKDLDDRFPSVYGQTAGLSEVGDGWHGLLIELAERALAQDDGYSVSLVKETFGGLRVHGNGLYEISDEIEGRSMKTCEECGAHGESHRYGGWYATRCYAHGMELARQRKDEKMVSFWERHMLNEISGLDDGVQADGGGGGHLL